MKKMYVDINEFMKDAQPSDLIKRINESCRKYYESEEYREEERRRAAGIALLMHQVVGAEVL